MQQMILKKENIEFLEHYGVKGMKWGVRKQPARGGSRRSAGTVAKKVVRDTFLGIPESSLLYKEGRTNFKASVQRGKARVGKITDHKVFKIMVFDKDANVLTKRGREGMRKAYKKSMEQKYAQAVKREKATAAAQKAKKQKRAAETRKLIDQLIADDKAISKRFGTKYDETKERTFLENFFADDLKED